MLPALSKLGMTNRAWIFSLTVHDEQLVDDIPVEKLLIHDVPVDIICTPTQIIYTNTSIPKPQGLLNLATAASYVDYVFKSCFHGLTEKSSHKSQQKKRHGFMKTW